MNTPKKPNDDYHPDEISNFSNDHRYLDSQLKERITELEKKNDDLQLRLHDREMLILDFTQKMNDIKTMKIENVKEGSLEFLEIKIDAYEEIVPPTCSYPLQIMENILYFDFGKRKDEIEKMLNKMQQRLSTVSKNLKNIRKNAKKSINENPVFSVDMLTEALNGFKNHLRPEVKSGDLIYMDGWDINIKIPLENFKRCLFFMLQAEEIVRSFHEGLMKNYLHLKANVQNFQRIVEILPSHFEVPANLKASYGEVILGLKEFNNCLQNQCPLLLKPEKFTDLKQTQQTLVEAIKFNQVMMKKGDDLQEKINLLFPKIEEYIREIYIQTKKVRGAEIKHVDNLVENLE